MAIQSHDGSTVCDGCTACPNQGEHRHGGDCAPGCTVTSAVLPLPLAVPQVLPSNKVVPAPGPSIVDFLQPPPTPPPIA